MENDQGYCAHSDSKDVEYDGSADGDWAGHGERRQQRATSRPKESLLADLHQSAAQGPALLGQSRSPSSALVQQLSVVVEPTGRSSAHNRRQAKNFPVLSFSESAESKSLPLRQ